MQEDFVHAVYRLRAAEESNAESLVVLKREMELLNRKVQYYRHCVYTGQHSGAQWSELLSCAQSLLGFPPDEFRVGARIGHAKAWSMKPLFLLLPLAFFGGWTRDKTFDGTWSTHKFLSDVTKVKIVRKYDSFAEKVVAFGGPSSDFLSGISVLDESPFIRKQINCSASFENPVNFFIR